MITTAPIAAPTPTDVPTPAVNVPRAGGSAAGPVDHVEEGGERQQERRDRAEGESPAADRRDRAAEAVLGHRGEH